MVYSFSGSFLDVFLIRCLAPGDTVSETPSFSLNFFPETAADPVPGRIYCYECKKWFSNKNKLARHENTKRHKQNWKRMFKEVFENSDSDSDSDI